MQKFVLAALAMTGLVALSAPANALPSTWDFTTGNGTISGNHGTFTSDDGKVINAYGFSAGGPLFGTSFGGGTPADLTQGGGGLGVDHGCDISFIICLEQDNNQVDNAFSFDFIVLELPTDEWLPLSMSFGNLQSNDDYEIWGSNEFHDLANGIFDIDPDAIYVGPNSGPALNPLDLQNDTQGNGNLQITGVNYRYIYISGEDGFLEFNDDFRLRGFTGEVQNAVPEPATLALLGLGLAGFGAMRRRKKA